MGVLTEDIRWQAPANVAALKDGPYTLAIRPNHAMPVETAAHSVRLEGHVQVTELSGSESSAHFDLQGQSWVSLSPGVHPYFVGEVHAFYLDPSHCFFFAPDGALVA